eukprot:gnl/Dysnectes_brevis/5652_a8255_778.p1 GENE.gnl/Dysnectes_brevis/5652_a8255_778~~gnl/Dysnectes_brevis/5652_a8255_778.p1  ORF type:complete len:310 (-),score=54.16 gnl/Dysnectes_brevis/5652_a8255_778:25-954(-)
MNYVSLVSGPKSSAEDSPLIGSPIRRVPRVHQCCIAIICVTSVYCIYALLFTGSGSSEQEQQFHFAVKASLHGLFVLIVEAILYVYHRGILQTRIDGYLKLYRSLTTRAITMHWILVLGSSILLLLMSADLGTWIHEGDEVDGHFTKTCFVWVLIAELLVLGSLSGLVIYSINTHYKRVDPPDAVTYISALGQVGLPARDPKMVVSGQNTALRQMTAHLAATRSHLIHLEARKKTCERNGTSPKFESLKDRLGVLRQEKHELSTKMSSLGGRELALNDELRHMRNLLTSERRTLSQSTGRLTRLQNRFK